MVINGSGPRTFTLPDPAHGAGLLREPVVGIRIVGTTIEHRLPADFDEIRIGAGVAAAPGDLRAIRLEDPSVSRLHARIERRGPHLLLVDAGSKNGCYAEDERRAIIHLVPGGWFRLGNVPMVAFSYESERARAVFQRYLGFGEPAQLAVDSAHHAAARRRHMVLLAPAGGGVTVFARSIHAVTAGPPWPIVLATRIAAERAAQKQLLLGAGHGTLVVPLAVLPEDRSFLLDTLRARTYDARAIFIADAGANVEAMLGAFAGECVVVRVPAIAERRPDLLRVVTDTVTDHAGPQGASAAILTVDDGERVLALGWPGNYDEVDQVAERLVALRVHRSVRKAARALGLSPGTLSEWAKGYGFQVDRLPGGSRRER